MWPKSYRDYKIDEPLKKYKVEPGQGIQGCEMHDLNGWGNLLHVPLKKQKKGLVRTLLETLFKKFSNHPNEHL